MDVGSRRRRVASVASLTNMPADARRLANRYFAYTGIYTLAASVIWGINTLFLLGAGLSITEVFIANAAFSVGTVLFEVPTGVVADTIGRRASFLLSLVVLATSTLLYVALSGAGAGVVAFSLVSVLLGLGYTFYSGAMEAWVVDGIRARDYSGDLDRVFARSQIISGIAILIGTVGGGFLGQIDLAIPYLVRSALLVLLLAMAFVGMHDVGFQPRKVTWKTLPSEARSVASDGLVNGWRPKPLRLVMVAGAVQNGFFFWAWYAWQPYFLELVERDAVWVAGIVAGALSLAMILGTSLVGAFTKICGRRTTLLAWAGLALGLSAVGVGLADTFPIALAFLLILAVAMGVTMPVRQAFVHGMVTSSQRATVVSLDSMVSGVGAIGGQVGLGVLADREGYSTGYVVGGVVALGAVPFIWLARRLRPDADAFAGSEGTEPSCPPVGLPAISSVEGLSVVRDEVL